MELTSLLDKSDDSTSLEKEEYEGEASTRPCFQTLIGLLNAFGFVIFVVASSVCVTLLNRSIGDFELSLFRYIVSVLIFSSILVYEKEVPFVPKT